MNIHSNNSHLVTKKTVKQVGVWQKHFHRAKDLCILFLNLWLVYPFQKVFRYILGLFVKDSDLLLYICPWKITYSIKCARMFCLRSRHQSKQPAMFTTTLSYVRVSYPDKRRVEEKAPDANQDGVDRLTNQCTLTSKVPPRSGSSV